jgi:uncharacterized phage infection (PIP) family protein YhgE
MFLKRIIGILLIIGAVAGIIFSLIGLIELWRYRPAVTKTLVENLALVDQTLTTTQDALTLVGKVVLSTSSDVKALQASSTALAQAIQDTSPSLDSLISLTGKDFPASIKATQTSLASAQSSALVVDNVLAALTSIPFSPVATYAPAVPLHTALGQISASLDSLLPTLGTIKTSLVNDKTNISSIQTGLTQIVDTTQGMSSSLANAQTDINQYIAVTTQLKANVETAQRDAPTWIMAIAWILSFLLGWLMIAQLGLGLQGRELMRGDHKA